MQVHIFLHLHIQAVNVDALCAVIPAIAVDRCPEMEERAQAVANKHGRGLLLFSECHNKYNSSKLFEAADLSALRKWCSSVV